jgi:hypothetical protein
MAKQIFHWKRFWSPRGGRIILDDGFLFDPESRHAPHLNPGVVSFDQIATKPCLVLLGEPGIGKSTALAHDHEEEALVRQAGEDFLWRDLNTFQSDLLLVQSVFEDPAVTAWRGGSGCVRGKGVVQLTAVPRAPLRFDTPGDVTAGD